MRDQFVIIFSYLHGIWQYRWSALVIAWLIAIPGWAVIYSLPDLYSSTAIVSVNTKSVITPLLKDLAARFDIEDNLDVMSAALLSKKNLKTVVRETDMHLLADDSEAIDDLAKELAGSVLLVEDEENNQKDEMLFVLSHEGESPELVFQVVSKLLSILLEATASSGQTDASSALTFLDQQIVKYEERLSIAERNLAKFKRDNVGFMPDNKDGYYAKLQQAQEEADDIRAESRIAKQRLAEIKKQLSGEKPILGNSAPQAEKLREYRALLTELRTQFTEQHPDIQSLRETIAELLASGNGSMDVNSGVPLEYSPAYQDLKVESHAITAEIQSLKTLLSDKLSNIEALRKSADVIPEVEAKLARLNRDYNITDKRYLKLVEKRETAQLAQEVGLSGSNINTKVITKPQLATEPSGPPRLIFYSIVFIAAIIASLGWGFLRYLMHPTYIDSSQLKNNIDLPVLGSIGLFLTVEHKRKRRLQLMTFLSIFSLLILAYVLLIMPDTTDTEEEMNEVVSLIMPSKEAGL